MDHATPTPPAPHPPDPVETTPSRPAPKLRLPDRSAAHLAIGRRLFGPVWLEAELVQRLELKPPAFALKGRVEA